MLNECPFGPTWHVFRCNILILQRFPIPIDRSCSNCDWSQSQPQILRCDWVTVHCSLPMRLTNIDAIMPDFKYIWIITHTSIGSKLLIAIASPVVMFRCSTLPPMRLTMELKHLLVIIYKPIGSGLQSQSQVFNICSDWPMPMRFDRNSNMY